MGITLAPGNVLVKPEGTHLSFLRGRVVASTAARWYPWHVGDIVLYDKCFARMVQDGGETYQIVWDAGIDCAITEDKDQPIGG